MAHNGQQDTCPEGLVIPGQVVPESATPKTFCEVCAKGYLPRLERPSEPTLAQKVSVSIGRWQPLLNLNDWVLCAAEAWDPQGDEDEAYLYRQPAEQEAIIAVHPDTPDHYVDRLVVHELLHLVMGNLDMMAMNHRSIEVMDLYQAEQERVINLLSTTITDIGYEPVHPVWRKRFEVDGPPQQHKG
jgi:hypothetical protein